MKVLRLQGKSGVTFKEDTYILISGPYLFVMDKDDVCLSKIKLEDVISFL